MKASKRAAAAVASILLGALQLGCATSAKTYEIEDLKLAAKACYESAYADQKACVRNWFTRYLDCRRQRVMPIEIYAYRKEIAVRAIYDDMYKVAPMVDGGTMPVKSAYDRWDRMIEERLGTRCLLKVAQQDGGGRCAIVHSKRPR